ncbi:MAG: M28 family peptidase [Gemmatimonadales bacterium]
MPRPVLHAVLTAATLVTALPLGAQAPTTADRLAPPSAAVRRGAEAISVEYLRYGVYTIADDSMMGRATPSPGLEKTAAWVASQFREAGLRPGGDNGDWQQRYPVYLHRLAVESSAVRFTMAGGPELNFPLTSSALMRFGPRGEPATGPVVVLSGIVDTVALAGAPIRGAILVWAATMPTGGSPAGLQSVLRTAVRAGAAGVVLISQPTDPAIFPRLVANQARSAVTRDSVRGQTPGIPVVEIPETEIAAAMIEAADQLAALRASPTAVIQPMPEWSGTVDVRVVPAERAMAPNTVGILDGSDPELRHEYIVFSAHMDHVGVGGTAADSIFNGADDDASGTVGIVALARAYAQPGARPKRSMVFLTVSGEERGLWGSAHFADNPTVPAAQIVANVNMDMIGRNWEDTVVVIGKEHSDLGQTLHAVARAHPELNMAMIDDLWPEQNFYRRSDHFNFARNGVPILFFFTGVHEDYHRVSDTPDKIGYEKMSRILKMAYFLGQEIGNRPGRPQWNPESYQQIVRPRTP